MVQRLSRLVALGFGSGLSPVAPGTAGTLWAWVVWRVASPWLEAAELVAVIVLGFALGVWACQRTADALGVADHGAIVWDEVIAFWIVLALLPATFGAQLAGFVLFRFFDIAKPPPIRHVDATLHNGFGVMADDLIAAFYTLLAIAAWTAWT
jgi:phosphatidylglycerophosphatase A